MAKDLTAEEGSPEEEATETPEVEATETDDTGAGVKVPESFQQEVADLVMGKTDAQLDFITSAVTEQRKKLISSQKKNNLRTNDFTTEDMPSGN